MASVQRCSLTPLTGSSCNDTPHLRTEVIALLIVLIADVLFYVAMKCGIQRYSVCLYWMCCCLSLNMLAVKVVKLAYQSLLYHQEK
jgi:hypothetical protein